MAGQNCLSHVTRGLAVSMRGARVSLVKTGDRCRDISSWGQLMVETSSDVLKFISCFFQTIPCNWCRSPTPTPTPLSVCLAPLLCA